jgi:hypothetical protein
MADLSWELTPDDNDPIPVGWSRSQGSSDPNEWELSPESSPNWEFPVEGESITDKVQRTGRNAAENTGKVAAEVAKGAGKALVRGVEWWANRERKPKSSKYDPTKSSEENQRANSRSASIIDNAPKASSMAKNAFKPSPYAPMTWMENNLSPESMSMIYGRGTQIKPLYDIQTRGIRNVAAKKFDSKGRERQPRTAVQEPYAGYSMDGSNSSVGTGGIPTIPWANPSQTPSYTTNRSTPEDLLHRSRMYGGDMYNPGEDPAHTARTSGMNNPPPRLIIPD